ncbi:MAG: ABC transporter ATP-binding protein/permease [Gammaproteobacteria bacterium]|nr:ABC transporter ATP-binding protein/permease [Gammaproteobacteria bacterium]
MSANPFDQSLTTTEGERTSSRVIRRLLPFLKPYSGRIGIAMAFLLTAKVAGLAVPMLLKRLIDTLGLPNTLAVIPVALVIAYGGARLSERVFTEMRQIVFARVMARSSRLVMLSVFRHLHALSLRFHLNRQTGGVTRDVERGGSAISDLLDWTLYTIIPTLIEVVLVTAVLVYLYDIYFALITLGVLIAYVAWTIKVTEWRTRYYRASVEADTAASASAVDSLLNYETVKYFNNEEHEAQRYDASLRKMEEANVMSYKTLAVLNVGQSAIIAIGVTALMFKAAAGVVSGKLSVGDLVLVNAYLLQMAMPLNYLGMMYREVKQALTNIERLWGLLDEKQEVRDRAGSPALQATQPRVSFEDVHFGYDPRREILHGIHFEIPPGHRVAVVGHSGSGKSTLARLLYRFYDIGSGAIRIDGHDIRELEQDSVRAAIGIVPQDTVLFNDTVRYNIRYGRPSASDEEVEAAAQAAHIHNFIQSLPDGYETSVGERGLKLSGGEKQRVAIARALLKNPAILIFDEATSALDSASEKAIQAELDRIAIGRTTLIIAHRLSTVMDANQILVMDAGNIVERGSHAQLIALDGHYAAMWRLQQRARETVSPVE